ncbi:hypothetical protein F7734_05165 [Scytonema sp. UIC 10036]|uniref:hypothetical protein n=1 Tax=Scytonema sp. UIC 10036 TaxID=2304196 RepID=UPI0012DA468B|nr:hypothetical protein [Scytonema sp. UIC 10036]MUG91893.1 hypothetical protein [Scytonema sp. UIC 10036]
MEYENTTPHDLSSTQERADPLNAELFDRISAEIGDEILGIHGTLLPAATEM